MFDDINVNNEICRTISRLRLAVNCYARLTQGLFGCIVYLNCGQPAVFNILANWVNIKKYTVQTAQRFSRASLRPGTQRSAER